MLQPLDDVILVLKHQPAGGIEARGALSPDWGADVTLHDVIVWDLHAGLELAAKVSEQVTIALNVPR